MMQFWSGEIKCARCGGVAECDLVQRQQDGSMQGALAGGWVGVNFMEKMPTLAKPGQPEAMTERARYRLLSMPCCSEACATELVLTRALAMVRTKNERATMVERFQAVLDESSGGKKK